MLTESPSQPDKGSQGSQVSLWSQFSLGGIAGADLQPQKPDTEITDTASLHETTSKKDNLYKKDSLHKKDSQEGKVNLRDVGKSLRVVHTGSTVTLADMTLGADDGSLAQEEHPPSVNESHSQAASDATLVEDDLSQPDIRPLLTDEDNTSQEIVTIEDVSAPLDSTNKRPPVS